MPSKDDVELLGGWEGYRVGVVQRFAPGQYGPKAEVWIELIRAGPPFICSGCARSFNRGHDWEERRVRDLPILDAETHIHLQRFRVDCPDCGRVAEQLPWLAKHARETRRLTESVARLCQIASIKHVAEFYGLSWDTVKRIDKAYLAEHLGEPDLSYLRLLALDEFAIKRGQRCATIFVEPERKEVLCVCRGRSREDIRPFLEKLGEAGRKRIQWFGVPPPLVQRG